MQEGHYISEADNTAQTMKFDINDYIDNQDCEIETIKSDNANDFVKQTTDSPTLQELRKSGNISLEDLEKEEVKPDKKIGEKDYKEIEKDINEEQPTSREELEEFSNLIIEGIDFIFDKGAGMFGYQDKSVNNDVIERKKTLLKKLTTDVLLKHNVKFKIEYLLILVFVSYATNKLRSKTKNDESDNKKVNTKNSFEFGIKTDKKEVKATYVKDTVKDIHRDNIESDIDKGKVVKIKGKSIADIVQNK